MLLCVKPFFIFVKGGKYYCSHVADGHFFIANKGAEFHAGYIKVPFGHARKFEIIF